MPVEYTTSPDGSVVVANCFGKLEVPDVTDSVRFAFGQRHIEPSQDRIVKVDPKAQLHELDLEALQSIQQCVLDYEARDGREVSFRAVLVHSAPTQKVLLELYKAIWDDLVLPGVEFSVVASEAEAWKALGLKPPSYQSSAG